MSNLKQSFNFAATMLGGIGTFIFTIGTITEMMGATPGRNGYDADATMLAAGALAASVALLAVGIRGQRKQAAEEKAKNDSNNDPKPPAP